MFNPVAKLLKQVESWQSEAGHKRLQSTLTDSEGLDAHNSDGDRPPRDVMLEVRASLAKSQQLHADRMARIRQDYNDGIARIEAERKRRAKPAHAATAPAAGLRESTVSCGEPFKSATSAPIMQRRASADVLTYQRERQPSSTPAPLGTRPAFQHKVSMQRHGLPMQGEVEELRASVKELNEMLGAARKEGAAARQEASAARAEASASAKAMLASMTADVHAAREEVHVAREEARVSAEEEAVARGSVMELHALTAELRCKLEVATEAQLNWENHKLQERGAKLLAASASQAEEHKAMLATALQARASAEAELAATASQAAELKAMLARAREEARDARHVAYHAANDAACKSAETEVALTELRSLASELEGKLEAAREVEHRRKATEAQLCRKNQQLQARVAELLAEREAKLEVAPESDLVLDGPDFGRSSSEPVSRARPMLPAHLRPLTLTILEQQARLMRQSANEQESARVNERLELARLHNRHVAKMAPAATKMAWLVRGHLTRARLRREREAARMAEFQRETEKAWAKTLSRPAPSGRRGKRTRRQHVLEREAATAYFNLRGLPPPDSEVARHARELAEAVKAHRARIDARNEGILQGKVLVVDPREVREEQLREEKLSKLRRAGFLFSDDTRPHAPAPQADAGVEGLVGEGSNEEADDVEEGEWEVEEEGEWEGEEKGEGEDGWERVLDPSTGREYFWHNVTDEVRWTEPPELLVNRVAAE